MSEFTEKLAAFLGNHLFAEKILIAPSIRVGNQWLDSVTSSGTPVFNTRVSTLKGFVLDLVMPFKSGFAGESERLITTARAFANLKTKGHCYLSSLTPDLTLYSKVSATIDDMRMSGELFGSEKVRLFELDEKGREILFLYHEYIAILSEHHLSDYADVLVKAESLISNKPDELANRVIIIPDYFEEDLVGLERQFWNSIPLSSKHIIESKPVDSSENVASDRELLKWVLNSSDAPEPVGDSSVSMFRSVGERAEIYHIFRYCIRENIPLDQVEIIYSDYNSYAPIVYNVCSELFSEMSEIPVTFAEGIPVVFSLPGRLLAGLIDWFKSKISLSQIVRFYRDGLLNVELEKGENFRESSSFDEVLADMTKLYDLRNNSYCFLEKLKDFFSKYSKYENKIDRYAFDLFNEEITEFMGCIKENKEVVLNVQDWLEALVEGSKVNAKPPVQGCVFVSPIGTGGHSGRAYSFVVGLDDGRFPVSGVQDPLLLDSERKRISEQLTLSSARLKRSGRELELLFSRLTGKVFLSYSCRNIGDNTEKYPSSLLLSVFRILKGEEKSSFEEFFTWIGKPFGSYLDDCAVFSSGEWLVNRLCRQKIKEPLLPVCDVFTNVRDGLIAVKARESEAFTDYDGFVPEAGIDHNPYSEKGPVLSSSRLEFLAKNPFDYFLSYILKLEPPDEEDADPYVWLDAMERGTALHETFRKFMTELKEKKLLPNRERDYSRIVEILDDVLLTFRKSKSCVDDSVYERERAELMQTCRIFLTEEEKHLNNMEPMYFEAALGMDQYDDVTELDVSEPVELVFSSGKSVKIRGKIDRVDRVVGTNSFLLWDYKTGSTYSYKRKKGDPFNAGRIIQNAFYIALIENRLKEVHAGATIKGFGYFFPGTKARGERIWWDKEELKDGLIKIQHLCNMLKEGSFPCSDDISDLKYSDFSSPAWDSENCVNQTKLKMENSSDRGLDSFRKLRGKLKPEETENDI